MDIQQIKRPKSNQEYWDAKILRNQERDRKVNERLKNEGWKVLRFWESEIKSDINSCVKVLMQSISQLELIAD
ncbi:MAG: DUF559 domain-containing protein [Ekhidna sp.]|nr:DUF559 domain-containing protein [Ekhidna sp.]